MKDNSAHTFQRRRRTAIRERDDVSCLPDAGPSGAITRDSLELVAFNAKSHRGICHNNTAPKGDPPGKIYRCPRRCGGRHSVDNLDVMIRQTADKNSDDIVAPWSTGRSIQADSFGVSTESRKAVQLGS